MATTKRIEKWYEENKKMLMKLAVIDNEKILTSPNGYKKGCYLVSVMLKGNYTLVPMYVGEAGADGKTGADGEAGTGGEAGAGGEAGTDGEAGAGDEHGRCIADRIKEHLHRWFAGGCTEYWTGIKKSELISGKFRFHFHIVGESNDPEERKRMESETILTMHPYLQYGPYKKYNSSYNGLDLCIEPWDGTRRKAFLNRLKEMEIDYPEKVDGEKDLIGKILNGVYQADWEELSADKYETEPYATEFRKLITRGSNTHKRIKEIIEGSLGIVSGGRCKGMNYDYMIRLLSHAMEAETDQQ